MKIAITGHTSGIGQAVATWMIEHGHEVQGFSRSTGYDISLDATLNQILEESVGVDIFINNAYVDMQQTKLLYMFHKAWLNQQKTIVNIGSCRTQRLDYTHFQRPTYPRYYVASKASLDYGCKELWNYSAWPRVMLVKPCGTATPRAANYPVPDLVAPSDMADLICSAIFETRCRVQELNFDIISSHVN
jgi:hypothetical protein